MSKFNQTNTIKTTNISGHVAYSMQDKDKLVTQVLTSFFCEQKFYGDNSSELVNTAETVLNKEPSFVANLARYARKEMHLRSVSHALTALIAHNVNGKQYTRQVVKDVVERPDDITEILACYLALFDKPVPNALKKALAESFDKFDLYQISKYNGGNKDVKFRDVLRLTHPTPKNKEQEELFGLVLRDELPSAERWETELSKQGNTTEVWERLIDENKLGYMAMLRNLRNILNASPSNVDKVYEKLTDKAQVLKSKQLPFRFFSAYREVINCNNCTNKVLDALETALEYSVENLPKLSGKTVIAVDVSSSMSYYPISARSRVFCSDIACLLAALASKICEEYIVYTFDTDLDTVTFSQKKGIIASALDINVDGGGTDLMLPLEEIINNRIFADRIIMLSDNEINREWIDQNGYRKKITCQSLVDKYRKAINKDLWVHAIDLQGYGTQQFIGAKTNIIAGFSERVLEFIDLAEKGIETQVQRIENYK